VSDLEFFGTISLFVAGIVLLIYLFTIRKKIMRTAMLLKVQAKAKIHRMSAPTVDPWDGLPGRDRPHKPTMAELDEPIKSNIVPWNVTTYRNRG